MCQMRRHYHGVKCAKEKVQIPLIDDGGGGPWTVAPAECEDISALLVEGSGRKVAAP